MSLSAPKKSGSNSICASGLPLAASLLVSMKSFTNYRLLAQHWQWVVALGFGLELASSLPSQAQVIGASGTGISAFAGPGCPVQCITVTNGVSQGENLFHSFHQFDVQTGEQVLFEHDSNIRQIFGRIASPGASDIDGLLTTQGASLYLLNPNGFIFRGNAQVNIADTFAVSTGDRFTATGPGSSGGFFPVDLSEPVDLFSVSPNTVLIQFPSLNSNAQIRLLGNENGPTSILNPSPGRTLALLAGDIKISDYTLHVPENQLVLGGFKRSGAVFLRPNLITLGLTTVSDVATAADINIEDSLLIPNGSLVGGVIPAGTVINGEVRMRAFDLELRNSKIHTLAVPVEAEDGGIRLSLRGGRLSMTDSEFITRAEAGGSAGNINIARADSLLLDDSHWSTFTDREGGRVTAPVSSADGLFLTGGIQLINGSEITTTIGEQAQGDAGRIDLAMQDLLLSNSRIQTFSGANTLGSDRADINLSAVNEISLMNQSEIAVRTTALGSANRSAGNLTIEAPQLSLEGSLLRSITQAGSGNIRVLGNNVDISGGASGIVSLSEVSGGDIDIEAVNIRLADGAIINLTSRGVGSNLAFDASSLEFDDANIQVFSQGDGSNITLRGSQIGLVKSSIIIDSQGAGGNVELNAANQFLRDESQIRAFSQANGGNISLSGTDLSLETSSEIGTFSASTGGDIDINLSGDLSHLSGSSIQASANQSGGGTIAIQANALTSLPNSNADILFTGLLEPSRLSLNADFDEAVFAPLDLAANGAARTNMLNQFYYLLPEPSVVIPPVTPVVPTPPAPDDNPVESGEAFSMADVPPWLASMFSADSEENELSLALSQQGKEEIASVQGCGRRDASVSGLRVSDRGGIEFPPNSLSTQQMLEDLGVVEVEGMTVTRNVLREAMPMSPAATFTEATAWKRDRQGNIALIQPRSLAYSVSMACDTVSSSRGA